jgi:NitT/TauT family transport system substrate-binding protein
MAQTRRIIAACFTLALGASLAHAQETNIIYSLTSPVPTVAEAPHASVPAILGYWEEEGLNVQVNPVSGSTQATQLVAAGTSHFTMATVEPLIVAKQQGADILAVYNHTREPIYTIAVTSGSDITELTDLKGKTIGVLSLSSGAVPFAKAMLNGAGVDPDREVSWLPIGIGAQAVHAINADQVDAIAYWDWGYAIMENAGIEFRHFTTEETQALLALAIVANADFVENNPEATAGFARGIAKAALFTITNPEAAVRIHWERYPDSRPTDVDEDQALREAVHVLEARLQKYKIAEREDPRFGAFTAAQWEATQNFLYDNEVVSEKLDVSEYYSHEFIEMVNDFDHEAVIEQAKNYR